MFNPPKKGAAFITYTALVQQANIFLLKTTPTIASGDFKVSIDGAALANLATLPTNTPAGSAQVKYSLSAAEMTGDNIGVTASDQAGAEWCDRFDCFPTSTAGPSPALPWDMKYATGATIRFCPAKAGAEGLAASTDYTPLAADCQISIDGGAFANCTNTAAWSNGQLTLALIAAELTGKAMLIKVVDASPKAIDDLPIYIRTFGNPSAYYPDDVSTPGLSASDAGTAQAGAAGTITLRAGAPSVKLDGQLVYLTGGTGAGQVGVVAKGGYDTTTKIATMVNNWPSTAPDATTTYVVWPIQDVFAEMKHADTDPTAAPSSTDSVWNRLRWAIFKGLGSTVIQTPTTSTVKSRDGSTAVATATVAQVGTTVTKGPDT